MAVEQCLFLSRLVVYCIIWILSWMCWIPLCIILDYHQGYCLLYADSTEYGPVAACGYTISVPIIFSLIYAGYMAISYVFKIGFYNRNGHVEETVLEFIITVVMDCLSWIFMFVNACLISAGFNALCWNTFDSLENCSIGHLRHPVFGADRLFFDRFKIAEVASWLSWILWLAQVVTGLMALSRSGILPTTSALSIIVPCKPQCICSCKLQFTRKQQLQTSANGAEPPVSGKPSARKTMASTV